MNFGSVHRAQHFFRKNSIFVESVYSKIATDVGCADYRHVKAGEGTFSEVNSDLMQCLTVSPNPEQTPTNFWSDVTYRIVKDGAAAVIPKYEKGVLTEIHLADSIESIEDGQVTLIVDTWRHVLPIENVFIFVNPKPTLTIHLAGITSLIDNALHALSMKVTEGRNELRGILHLSTKVSDAEQRAYAEQRVKNMAAVASGALPIAYAESGETFQEIQGRCDNTATESELNFLLDQLHRSFGISKAIFEGDYTDQQWKAYFNSVLRPIMNVIEQEITRKHFGKTARTQGNRVKIVVDFMQIASLADFTEFAYRGIYSSVVTPNEAREVLNLSPIPDGDTVLSNLNAIPLTSVANPPPQEGGNQNANN